MSEQVMFEEWVILELMGHRRLAGKLTEATLGGGALLRLDIPKSDGTGTTQYYSPSAVYCITPTTEEIARAVAIHNEPEPVYRFELPEPRKVAYTETGAPRGFFGGDEELSGRDLDSSCGE